MNFFSKFSKKPYIIAEIGSNFDQDIKKAFELIKSAKKNGANAVKFQLFKSELMHPRKTKLFEIFKSIELNSKWIPKISKFCKKYNIDFFASTFDKSSSDTLIKNKVPILKLASSEAGKISDIIYAAKTNLPVIFSTGMSDLVDIVHVVDVFKRIKNENLCLMYAVSLYPPKPKEMNLLAIRKLKNIFGLPIGFSDHTSGHEAACIAVAMGATVFEKHITLDKNSNGPDHFYATEPNDFKNYVKKIKDTFKMLGEDDIKFNYSVQDKTRRSSLYWKKNLKKQKKISRKDIYIQKNSALGLPVYYFKYIVDHIISENVYKKTPILLNNFKQKK